MHYFYILYSESKNKYYYGSSHDIEIRLKLHNDGATKSTKSGIPWQVVNSEPFETKTEAIIREKELKKIKSRKYTEQLIAFQK